jgi:VanZ family protein
MKKIYQPIVNYKLTIITLAVIVFLSLSATENINMPRFLNFEGADKLNHLGMYGFLTLIYLIERTAIFISGRQTLPTKWYYILWIIIIGGVMEIIQPLISGREKDVLDFLANTSGVVMTYLGFLILSKFYNVKSMSSS